MSNNDLYCVVCKRYHHPVECPLDEKPMTISDSVRKEAEEIVAKRTHWFKDEDNLRRTRVACDPDELMYTIASALQNREDRIAELQAKLSKAEEALKEIANAGGFTIYTNQSDWLNFIKGIAKKALSNLKGGE